MSTELDLDSGSLLGMKLPQITPCEPLITHCGIYIHVWQSHVEIEDHSIAYFGRIAVFEALYG